MYNFFKRIIGFFKRLFGMSTDRIDYVPPQTAPLSINAQPINFGLPRIDMGLLSAPTPTVCLFGFFTHPSVPSVAPELLAHANRQVAQSEHPVTSLHRPEPNIFNPGESGQSNGFSFYRAGDSGTTSGTTLGTPTPVAPATPAQLF